MVNPNKKNRATFPSSKQNPINDLARELNVPYMKFFSET